jgi:DNA-binding response OmpR family regulator
MEVTSPLLAAGYGLLEPFDDSCSLQQGFAGLRVLLCEGQQHSMDTSALLASCDFSTTVAADAQHALDLLQDPSSHFDVILADTSVLGHGLSSASARALFDAAASSGTPLVLTAEQHTPSQVMEAVHAGAADVLDRPLSYSKVQNLWQHAVRASMTTSKSDTTKHGLLSMHQHAHHVQQQHQPCTTPTKAQVASQQHPAAAFLAAPRERPTDAAAAGVGSRVLSPMCLGLLDDCHPMEGLQCLDGLGGLELPPLVPSQFDFEPLDSILTDMQAAEHSAAPSAAAGDPLGSLFPSGSPSNSNALTAVAASLFGSSSEQQCSGNTQRVGVGELESCADATSGSPQSRRRKRECLGSGYWPWACLGVGWLRLMLFHAAMVTGIHTLDAVGCMWSATCFVGVQLQTLLTCSQHSHVLISCHVCLQHVPSLQYAHAPACAAWLQLLRGQQTTQLTALATQPHGPPMAAPACHLSPLLATPWVCSWAQRQAAASGEVQATATRTCP